MKKYLLVAVTLGVVGISAESNPFDLQKNLQKIDQDQAVLLSALQEMAENKDEFSDEEAAPSKEVETEEAPQVHDDVPSGNTVSSEASREAETTRPELIRNRLIEEETKSVEPSNEELMDRLRGETEQVAKKDVKVEMAVEEERIKKVKEAQAKIEEVRAEQVKAAAKRVEKEKEEKLEVEAYEAQRLVKKIEAEKLAAEEKKEALAKEEAQKVAREAAQKEKLLKVEAAKEVEAKKHAIVDINITKEEMMAKSDADKAYLDAVKEMD
jgi:hypothetical protein